MSGDTVAIIQARMGSKRLPGKVMLPLAGTPTLNIVHARVSAAKHVDRVVIATTTSKADDALVWHCRQTGMLYFRGSETDVLNRVLCAATAFNARTVVDVTADCPLVDPAHIDAVVGAIGYNDYASNIVRREWPDGLDVQAFRTDALKRISRCADVVREHVGWNILQHPAEFKIRHTCRPPKRYCQPEWGLTLDTIEDYALLRELFMTMQLQGRGLLFPVEDVLQHLVNNPKLLATNAMIARRAHAEGLWK